jgi:hypothetical protein
MFTQFIILAAFTGVFCLSKYALDRSGRLEINIPHRFSYTIELPPTKYDRHSLKRASLGTLDETLRPTVVQKSKSNPLIVVLLVFGGVFLFGGLMGILKSSESSRTLEPVAETPSVTPTEAETPLVDPLTSAALAATDELDANDTNNAKRIQARRAVAAMIRSANFVCDNSAIVTYGEKTALGETYNVYCSGFKYLVTKRPNGDEWVRPF